jgi:hypothetical protein
LPLGLDALVVRRAVGRIPNAFVVLLQLPQPA